VVHVCVLRYVILICPFSTGVVETGILLCNYTQSTHGSSWIIEPIVTIKEIWRVSIQISLLYLSRLYAHIWRCYRYF